MCFWEVRCLWCDFLAVVASSQYPFFSYTIYFLLMHIILFDCYPLSSWNCYISFCSYTCSALYIEMYGMMTAGFHTFKCFYNLKLFSFSAVVTIALSKFKFYCIFQFGRELMCLSRINPSILAPCSCLLFRLSFGSACVMRSCHKLC